MKRNMSKVVLIVEILSIALLHTIKIRDNQNAVISKIISARPITGPKAPYIFLKIK
jgi:hypothetical protein